LSFLFAKEPEASIETDLMLTNNNDAPARIELVSGQQLSVAPPNLVLDPHQTQQCRVTRFAPVCSGEWTENIDVIISYENLKLRTQLPATIAKQAPFVFFPASSQYW
jgi:hypothetical protein